MDEIDAGIIRLLGEDGRMTNKKVAQQLGISEAIAATRIRNMLASNTIRIVAQQSVLEGNDGSFLALLEFYVEGVGDIEATGDALSTFAEVLSAYETSRRPEICAYVRVGSVAELNDLVGRMTSRLPSLMQMSVLPVLDIHRLRNWIVNLHHPAPLVPEPRTIGEALMAELKEDGRQTVKALSKKLSLSQTAVHHRLNRLLATDGFRVVLVADSQSLGYNVWADLRATIAPREMAGAVERLSQHPDITVIAHLSGPANLTVFVSARSVADLDLFVREQIRTLPGLLDFAIIRVPRVIKYDYNYQF